MTFSFAKMHWLDSSVMSPSHHDTIFLVPKCMV